ncbi:methyl-accepting chemotaxis protein [Fictibacillus iocasae]|uniref:Methyl-accepting chemotaxis protein n=1 Tax=Fictibacillus iocasae TaxID=2715437 RepID=A0ABW2NHL8_9BACL
MKWTLRKKITGSFLIIAFLFAGASGMFYYYLKSMESSYNDLLGRRSAILANVNEIQLQASMQNSSMREYLLSQSLDSQSKIGQSGGNIEKLVQETLQLVQAKEEQDKLKMISSFNQEYMNKVKGTVATASSDLVKARDEANDHVYPIGRNIQALTEQMAERQQKLMEEGNQQAMALVEEIIIVVSILGVSVVALAIAAGSIISRMISNPVRRMTAMLRDIADGDLTMDPISVKNKDEVGDLADGINNMGTNLAKLIRQVRVSAEHVASSAEELTASAGQTGLATEQIAAAVQEVAGGTQLQVRSVEQIVESIAELKENTEQIASSIISMNEVSADSLSAAAGGNETITKTVKQMNVIQKTISETAQVVKGLEDKSEEINKIAEVITDISGQTNLLALNAAIEAARAGEHGKGFAVVADEVRKLAVQSANSAKQIGEIIDMIQSLTEQAVKAMRKGTSEVDHGMDYVRESGEAFTLLNQSVTVVSKQAEEVAAAAEAIRSSTSLVAESIGSISQMAESAAATTEEVSASTEEQLASMEEIMSSSTALADMAEGLNDSIKQFRV